MHTAPADEVPADAAPDDGALDRSTPGGRLEFAGPLGGERQAAGSGNEQYSAVVPTEDVDRAFRQRVDRLQRGATGINLAQTALVMAILVVYIALPGRPPADTVAFAAILAGAAGGSLLIAAAIWRCTPGTPGTLTLFLAWAVLDTTAISAGIAISGGARSDLYLVYLVLVVFQGGPAYPRAFRLASNAVSVLAYIVTLALLGWHIGTATVLLRLGILAALAWGTDQLSTRTVEDLRRQVEVTLDSIRRARLWRKVADQGGELHSLDENDIWTWVVESVVELGYQAASICLVDRTQDQFTVVQAAGLPPEFANQTHPLDRNMVGQVLHTRTTTVLDYAQLQSGHPAVRDNGIRTTIGTPICIGPDIVAVLVVGSTIPRQPGEEELAALELVASCGSHELANARQYHDERHDADQVRTILDATPQAMVVFDSDWIIRQANHQAALLFGYEPGELVGMDVGTIGRSATTAQRPTKASIDVLPPIGTPLRAEGTRKDGTVFPAEATFSTIDTPDGTLFSIAGRDIAERLALQQQLEYQSTHDALTDLPNRTALLDHLAPILAGPGPSEAGSDEPVVTVCIIDIDHFKYVNTSRGHDVGDQLIVDVVHRLRVLAEPRFMARMGGDEFAVLGTTFDSRAAAREEALKLLAIFEKPFVVDGTECHMSASAGVAFGSRGDQPLDVLRRADAAMYHAKHRGRSRVELHNQALTTRAEWRLDVSTALYGAIDRHELFLEYQPVVDLAAGTIVGTEALLRWQRGPVLIGPDTFIPIAEDSGLIVPVGRWVLGEACRKAAGWFARAGQPESLTVNINVSGRQLEHDRFIAEVAEVLDTTGIDPHAVVLEITESSFIEDLPDAVHRIEALRRLGVRIAIDDFGTGYSSLSSLSRLPVDEVKIDKSFVDGIGSRYDTVIRAVIDVAKTFDLQVVAEGVERSDQARRLQMLGCRYAQGFLFSRPLGETNIERLLDGHGRAPSLTWS